jgi:hypothetical protein
MADLKVIENKKNRDSDYPFEFSTSKGASSWVLAAMPHVSSVRNIAIYPSSHHGLY